MKRNYYYDYKKAMKPDIKKIDRTELFRQSKLELNTICEYLESADTEIKLLGFTLAGKNLYLKHNYNNAYKMINLKLRDVQLMNNVLKKYYLDHLCAILSARIKLGKRGLSEFEWANPYIFSGLEWF